MDNKLTNVFTYLNLHHDYAKAFDQFERIFNRYFKNITNYKLIEEEFILDAFVHCLMPSFFYYEDNEYASRIDTSLTMVTKRFSLDNGKDFKEISTNNIADISIEINNIRNDFTCLRFYNLEMFEYNDQYLKKVTQFLEDIQIWKLEGEEGWYDGQYEWDFEYSQILNIAYHCNSLEEVNDVYKLVWFVMLGNVYPKGIKTKAKIIWENLSYWKNIIDNVLTEKPLHIKPNEALHEENELDDNLSIEEKLEALKRKFSK